MRPFQGRGRCGDAYRQLRSEALLAAGSFMWCLQHQTECGVFGTVNAKVLKAQD